MVCPNGGCETRMLRKELGTHQDKCPEAVVPCTFADDGCTARMKRKNLVEHMAANKFEHLQGQFTTVKKELEALRSEMKEMEEGEHCIVCLNTSMSHPHRFERQSESFSLGGKKWYLLYKFKSSEDHTLQLYCAGSRIVAYTGAHTLRVFSSSKLSADIVRETKIDGDSPSTLVVPSEQRSHYTVGREMFVRVYLRNPAIASRLAQKETATLDSKPSLEIGDEFIVSRRSSSASSVES